MRLVLATGQCTAGVGETPAFGMGADDKLGGESCVSAAGAGEFSAGEFCAGDMGTGDMDAGGVGVGVPG